MERIVNDLSVRIDRLEMIVKNHSDDLGRMEDDVRKMKVDLSDLSERLTRIERIK